MSWWSNLYKKRAEDWVFARLADHQVPGEPRSEVEVPIDQAYLTITLRSMRITNVRKLTTKFYGIVHSFITLDHLSGKEAVFQTVSTPTELRKADPANLDRVIQVNKPLLGPVPYRGGRLNLELGLFSVAEADLAAPFIDVLESMASQAGVGIISTAIPFLQPLKKGIDALTGTSNDSILEIGVSANLEPPKTGWYVVMRAPKQAVTVADLTITPTDFRLVNALTKAPVQDYPYLVFTVTQSAERPDWFKLPDLTRTHQELQAAVRKGDYNSAKELIVAFKRTALTSDDLITKDAVRLSQLVKEKTEAALTGTMTAKGPDGQRELPPLESYELYQ
ncbi:MAG TPA: hypothetical protein VJ302_24585 [Blastocatellia bacterium]|nr:hypothetical protein [Blastocatellia bacterium]